jgi:hypothetical protein
MNRLLLFATAATVALTGAAFAQTNSTNTAPKPAASATAPVQSSPPPSPKTTATPTAPAQATMVQPQSDTAAKPAPKTTMGKNTAMKPMKSAHREHTRRRAAMKPTMAAQRLVDRETQALNVLEAKGYGGSYTDFQREGSNYSALVTHDGKQQKMMIDPDRGTVTP